jgi:hemoglobin
MRPEGLGPGAAVGVDEALIARVVRAFYERIRQDPTLGPIFLRVIGDDWDAHLAKMCDFWSSVLLMSGRFHGTPMAAHIRIGGLGPQHFALWLRMFRETVTDLCPGPAAELFVDKAKMIARSLQLAIAAQRGDLPPPRSATGDAR